MTNTNQEVTWDEMGRIIVKWMEGWELLDHGEHYENSYGKENDPERYWIDELYTSHDEIQEVLDKIKQEYLNGTYEKVLYNMYEEHCNGDVGSQGLHIDFEWDYKINPHPKIKLEAVYRTLQKAGEI